MLKLPWTGMGMMMMKKMISRAGLALALLAATVGTTTLQADTFDRVAPRGVAWPTQTADDVSFTAEEMEMIELPPEIEIPPPPEAISQPATPVMATADIDDDITIALTTFADNPIEDLPPPPTNVGEAYLSANPVFTPMSVRPEIRNRAEIQQALMTQYPAMLRNAGIGGTVEVWFFISEEGRVLNSRVSKSSGHAQLDEAALKVADVVLFTPALNRDQRVQVWIQLPITFQVR